jgi:hypothetical protein
MRQVRECGGHCGDVVLEVRVGRTVVYGSAGTPVL